MALFPPHPGRRAAVVTGASAGIGQATAAVGGASRAHQIATLYAEGAGFGSIAEGAMSRPVTRQPSLSNAPAIARPMPELLPVTTAC